MQWERIVARRLSHDYCPIPSKGMKDAANDHVVQVLGNGTRIEQDTLGVDPSDDGRSAASQIRRKSVRAAGHLAAASIESSEVGSISPGRLPPPMVDSPGTTEVGPSIASRHDSARWERNSGDREIISQMGIFDVASPFR